MEAMGLLVTLEARRGKEADAEAFLKSAQSLALDEKGTLKWSAIKLGPGSSASSIPLPINGAQCPLDRRDRESIGSASQRIAGGCPTD